MLLRVLDAKTILVIVVIAWSIHAGIVHVNLSTLKRVVTSVISFGTSAVGEGVQWIKEAH